MARLIALRQMGQLHSQITCKDKSRDRQLPEMEVNRRKTRREKDAGAWLEARLPALYGPHQNRHWVQVLHALTCRMLGL